MSTFHPSTTGDEINALGMSKPIDKPLRADAQRNRDKLLHVAHKMFKSEGISISMDEIARSAGVGVGTIYRHFPTKEDLLGAIMTGHKSRLAEQAAHWLRHEHPGEAFFQYFETIIREGVANKVITDALISNLDIHTGRSETAMQFWQGIEDLLVRAQQHGSVRADARLEDIKVLLIGLMKATEGSGSYPDRVVSILCDGLRTIVTETGPFAP
ncbi:TetR/AcrR family transcriptional regulator [Paenibacillus sp. strain BS8-2]